ncbi:sulfatase family protein [Lignipirellula cremea]|uniref:Choline-sulfatase n=1 Tax=Lignipirellula cremea TaxID=2528010 RepID=A0A518E2L8_9BACT|nr:sulfatase [Lignipirellula cremea]QDU98338.1 Choline-sulfatase [Lignipirellula cremea]
MFGFSRCGCFLLGVLAIAAGAGVRADELDLQPIAGVKPRNVIFILVDDHRYDAMGFLDHPFLKTPELDALAKNGVHMQNAFVTTSLCSPSRASILTGQYMHHHRVVDNNNKAPDGTIFFPQYLQRAGYDTAFIGKWHMGGESDAPRPGFDRWVSFAGQGRYYPPQNPSRWSLNVDGKRVPQQGYITDELTDYAIDWLDERPADKPFFLYLSHKAVHAGFDPAERHRQLYADVEIRTPVTQANTEENYKDKPMWVKNQRNSWHGVDFPYHSSLDVKEYYRQYCRALAGVDDSVGRIMDWLEKKKLDQSTLVMYMGDNGFLFGEHGLIDKRNAYEESMRVPMLLHCPELFPAGKPCPGVVANIDVAATVLQAAGLPTPKHMDGQSFLDLAAGKVELDQWRQGLLYEYYWEYNFPHTPTVFAIRGNQYKFIQYIGVWDTDELYDLKNDPLEQTNLIRDPKYREVVEQMRRQLWQEMRSTDGMAIPLGEKRGHGANLRRRSGSETADFPEYLLRDKDERE